MVTSVNVIMAIENLIPRTGTDGGVMWWLMRAHDDDVDELGDHLSVSESMMHMIEGNVDAALAATDRFDESTDNSAVIAARATALLMAEHFVEGHELLQRLIGEEMPLERRVVVANNLAWAAVHLGHDHLDEADRWSATAMALADPAPAAIMGTRARVLAELGRVDDALPLAMAVLEASGERERTAVHATLALLDLQRDDAFGARGNIDEAHRREPDSVSVAAIRTRVDARSLALVREQAMDDGAGSVCLPDVWASPAGKSTAVAARRALDAARMAGALTADDRALLAALDDALAVTAGP